MWAGSVFGVFEPQRGGGMTAQGIALGIWVTECHVFITRRVSEGWRRESLADASGYDCRFHRNISQYLLSRSDGVRK